MTEEPLNVYVTRVRTRQTDFTGVMYHGTFLDVFDDGRIETFRRMGYTFERMAGERWYPVIRHVECEYHAPARMDDQLAITVRIARLTRARMVVHYEARREETRLAVADVTFAFLDENHRPIPVPSSLRASIEEHAELLTAPS